ncbi:helix-turn-helix domain-containing protein [uncultured Mycolicibacterium sp.]|uniref:TetR/AcrR family transcriptional regulator n=1 Tax=uncultured Mycolicibacterium sp. TaxID=2320817 RepID=UPI0032B1ED9E
MPKNRQEVPLAERRTLIVDEARRQFSDTGYRGTTVTSIAKALNLTSAAIHWYFPTKDDLFAAAFAAIFQEATARVLSNTESHGDPRGELIGVLEEMHPYKGLFREAYERMTSSPPLLGLYAEVMDWVDQRLIAAISHRAPDGDIALLADTAHVLLEGLLVSVRELARPMAEMIDLLIDPLAAAAAARARKSR